MAESFIEKRKRELGISGSNKKDDDLSFIERRKMELGIIPDTRPKTNPTQAEAKSFGNNAVNAFGDKLPASSLLMAGSGGPSNAYKINPAPKNDFEREQQRIQDTHINLPNQKLENVANAALTPIKELSGAANYLIRDNPIGKFIARALPGDPSVRSQESTGSKTADKIADVTQMFTAPLAHTGAPVGQGIIGGTYQAAGQALSKGIGQKGVNALANIIPKVKPSTAQNIARVGLTEGIAGAAQGAGLGVQQGQDSGKEVLRNAGMGAAGGLVLGGIGGGVGPKVSEGAKNFKLAREINRNVKNTELSPYPAGSLRKSAQASLPDVAPNGESILQTSQLRGDSGVGISAFSKTNPYDSLSNDTRSQLVTRQEKSSSSLGSTIHRKYEEIFDDLHSLQQQDKILESVINKPVTGSDSVHTLGLNSRGADVVSKRIITDGLVDSNGQVIGDSLKTILSPLKNLMKTNKHVYVDLEDYLLNRHAITRFERGEKVFRDDLNWTPEYGAQKISEYDQAAPEFKEIADNLYNFNRQMVQSWLVDTGMIPQKMADAWLEANPYYVPNKRQFTDLEKTGQGYGGKQGYANQSNPVKGYQKGGSQRKIISPIEATIENVDSYVKTAKRNQVMQQYVKNIEQAPEEFSDWAEIVKQPEKKADISDINLDADGIDDIISRFSEDFDNAMRPTKLDKDNIVRVMVNGEPVHVMIKDKQLLNALTALNPEQAAGFMKLAGQVTKNMKLLTTGANPVFALTRNIFRDIPTAYIASKTRDNPVLFMTDLISAAVDIGRKRGAYKQFLNAGGGHSSSIAADRNLLAQSKRSILPQPGLKSKVQAGKEAYENFLNAFESAPRLAEFKRTLNNTGDLQAAVNAAQDITVNFKRRGRVANDLDKLFPYFNAAIQGMDKTARVYKDNPVKSLVKSAVGLSIPSMVLYALNYDDPNYQKVSNRVKDAFLLIPKGDGTFFKIAKPQEQGTIFTDIPERLMRMFFEEDPDAFRDFAERIRTTFLPPGVQGGFKKGGITDKLLGVAGDTIFGPVADLAANKNFSGSAIVPGYLENLSPELQYDSKTTSIAKKIGALTNTSPKQLDYFARQYTGVLGQFGQPLLAPGGDVGSTLNQQVTVDPVYSNDLSTEFYDYKDKLDQANTDKDLKNLPKWYDDDLRKQLGKISKNMSAVRKSIREVQDDQKLSNADKRKKLRDLQEQVNMLAEEGNNLARGQVPR